MENEIYGHCICGEELYEGESISACVLCDTYMGDCCATYDEVAMKTYDVDNGWFCPRCYTTYQQEQILKGKVATINV